VARDMFERAMGFGDYVALYGITRSEGLLLRYLTDAYKGLVQSVPEDAKTEDLLDVCAWLGELVRQVDSSLLDEWERLRHPDELAVEAAPAELDAGPPPVTANSRAFRVMVRNECFRRVELASRRQWTALADADPGWSAVQWQAAFEPFFAEHEAIGTGADARGAALFQVTERAGSWRVRQVLDDAGGAHEWAIVAEVDLAASDLAGTAVVHTVGVERL
jgi:hypothetical protein